MASSIGDQIGRLPRQLKELGRIDPRVSHGPGTTGIEHKMTPRTLQESGIPDGGGEEIAGAVFTHTFLLFGRPM